MEGVDTMKEKEYFKLEESVSRPGKYIIKANFTLLPTMTTTGSYNLLPARLLNITYAQYLRFCRDVVGAEISGKNSQYPIAYFTKTDKTANLLKNLNTRMSLVLRERETNQQRGQNNVSNT
jgi:hypothetical protein